MKRNILNVSVISLLALASTGAFVACNDYDDDIDSLKSRVDANEASIAANTSAIESIRTLISSGSVITSVQKSTTGDGGIVITLSNGTSYTISNGAKGETGAAGADGQDAKIWTIESTDNGYFWACDGVVTEYPAQGADGKDGADGTSGTVGTDGKDGADGKDGVDGTNGDYYIPNATTGKFDKVNGETGEVTATDIQWLGAGLTAVDNGSSVTISGLADAEGNALDAVVISKTGLLRSIVFVPDLYLNGVEATRYTSAIVKVGKAASDALSGRDNNNLIYATEKGEINEYTYLTSDGKKDSTSVISTQNAIVKFNLNPSEANIKDVKFSFTNINDVEYVTRADETPVPSITTVGEPSLSDGVLSVGYKLENGDALKYDGTLPVTSLVASLPDNSNISSDYFTITTSTASDIALAFSKENKYTTTNEDSKALYTTGKLAIESAASVDSLVYNQTFSLPENINIHYNIANDGGSNKTAKTISLADALNQWGLSATYEKFNYTLAHSSSNIAVKTSESDYIAINDGVINVRYATTASDGSVTWQDVTGTEGRSAIGKYPVVRVTLSDASKNVVAVGFIKFTITDPAAVTPDPAEPKVFLIASGSFDYLCRSTERVSADWSQMSGVAQALGNITKNEFIANYTIDRYTYAIDSTGYAQHSEYGFINYSYGGSDATNMSLYYTYNVNYAQNIRKLDGSKVTLYKKFTHNTTGEVVYLGFTITINPQPSVTIGNVQKANQVSGDAHRVLLSVPTPKNTKGLTVGDFYYNFPEYYDADAAGVNQPVVYAGDTAYTAGGTVTLTYRFADTQAKGVKVSSDKLTLLVDDSTKTVAVATIDAGTGKLQYSNSDDAKKLLNAGSAKSNISANVQVDATYGDCEILFEKVSGNVVTVDFYKPVYVAGVAKGYDVTFKSTAEPTNKTSLAAMFTMTNTWGDALFTGSTTGATDKNGIYDYYQIKNIKVDFSKVKNAGGATFSMEGATDNGDGTYTVDASTVANLGAAKVVTTYPDGGVITNTVTITFPITVEYYWGSQEATVTVNIKPNTAN